MAVRKENASKFSFTRAHLNDDIYGPEFIMDNELYARYSPTIGLGGSDYLTHGSISGDASHGDRSRIKNVTEDWLEQAELGARQHFAYSRRETPKTSINRQINQYEHVSEKCNKDDDKLVQPGRGLEFEIKRPEVFELFKKYYTEGSKVAEDILSNASSENFADDEDEQRKRFDYRQKVENHYRRLMEEGVMIQDPEGFTGGGSYEGVHEPPPDIANYQSGITESDWKAIDHHRSLSQEKEKDQLSSGGYESPGRPSALKQSDAGDKKKKKVRVRRHDSLIKCDSEPDLTSNKNTLTTHRENSSEGAVNMNDNVMINQPLDGYEERGRSRVTSRPPSFPGSRARASTSVPASLRRHRAQNSSAFGRGASPSSESSSYQSSPKGSPRRQLSKQDSTDDFFVHFRRREPSESSDRSSRIDPQTYQSYAAGILHSSRKSEPFLRLQKYYATVERITEIEQRTLLHNEMSGRRKYNTVSLKALSKLLENDAGTVEDILLSKYKLESLEELQDLYRELDEAKVREEFFFDTTNPDEFQWTPWKDHGLKSKEVSIQELYNIYERGRAARNTHVVRRKKYKDEIRRELSFSKIFEKYHYLDEASRREKILDDWWSQRSTSRRGSDASSIMSSGSVMGSYIKIMEEAVKKSKERPMYGYHIDEEPNKYEIHIDNVRRMSRSCPDVSEKSLHVRCESQPEPSGHDQEKENPLTRSASFKQSSFAASDEEKEQFYRVTLKPRSASKGGSRSSVVGPRDRNTRPASGRSSESGYDSIDGRSPKNTGTPEKKEEDKMAIHDLVSDTGHMVDYASRNLQAYPVQWQNRPQASRPQQPGSRLSNSSQWRGEIRGVMGKEQTRPRETSPRPQPKADLTETRRGITESGRGITRSSDIYLDEDLKERARRMRIREENFRERQRWRKDSKPDPGAVASALSIFEKNQQAGREKSVPNWKMQSKALPVTSAGLQNEVLNEESASSLSSYRSHTSYEPRSPMGNGNLREKESVMYRNAMPSRECSSYQRVESKRGNTTSSEYKPPDRPALPSSSVYTSVHNQPPVFHSSSASMRNSRSTVKREVAPDTVSTAKSRLVKEMGASKPVPKSALQQRSTNTPLGRYEAKIRSRSAERARRPRSALVEQTKDIDNSSLRRKDLSKSTPSLNADYVPTFNDSYSDQRDTVVSQLTNTHGYDRGISSEAEAAAGEEYVDEEQQQVEEPIYASVLKKNQRGKNSNGNGQFVERQYGVGQDTDQDHLYSAHSSNRYPVGGTSDGHRCNIGQTYLESMPNDPPPPPRYNSCVVTDDDTGEDEAQPWEASRITEDIHYGNSSSLLHMDPQSHANNDNSNVGETTFSHQPKPVRIDGRPFALSGLNITSPSGEEELLNDEYSSSRRKYPNLTDFRKEIEEEYRTMYDMTKKATMYDPAEASNRFISEDHLDHSYYGNVGARQEDHEGSDWKRGRPSSQNDIYDQQNTLSGSNDTLVIIGSDQDLPTGTGKSYGSVKMMKNTYEISRLEKSQSEPNLSQDNLDECGQSLNVKSDGEAGGDPACSPDFLNIRAKYESGYVSEESSPQKEYRSSLREHFEPEETSFTRVPRPSTEGLTQVSTLHHPQPQNVSGGQRSNVKNLNVKKDVPSPRHPWDIVRSSSPKIYDPAKSLDVLEDLGQEWERDKYKLSQKVKYHERNRSYPESVLSQDEERTASPEPQVAAPKPVTPLNRPPNPPPYVPPPDIKPSQRRSNLNKTNNPANISVYQPTSPPSQTWSPAYGQVFYPINPDGSVQLSSSSSASQEQSSQPTETEPAVQKASEPDPKSPPTPPAKSTASISLNAKSTAQISLSNKTRSKSLSGIEKAPPPRNTIRTGSASIKERHGSTSPSPTSRPMHHSASDITSYGASPGNTTMDRKRRDEEAARRKAQMDRIYMEQKQRRMQEEEAANAARRHNDVYLEDEEYWLRFTGVLEEDKAKPNKLDPTKLDIKILDTSRDRPQQKSPIPPPEQRFEEVDAMSLQRPKKKAGYTPKGKAVALYNFSAQNPKELSFKKGDTLYLLRQIDQNWYEGEHHGRVGIFPANYIKVTTSLETAHAAAFSREGTATAKYNFTAQTSVELPLRKGELVQLIRRVDDNWYEGRTGNRQGIFPVAYVDIVKEPDTPFGTPMSSVVHTPMTGSPGPLSPVSTISNGPAPTIPDAPDSPRSFDLSRSYGLASSQSNRSISPSSQQQLLQRQDYRPKSSASNLYGSYNGSSSNTYSHPHPHPQQHPQQQQDYSSSQYRSPPKDTSAYGYRDDAHRSYGMTNGGSGSGTYGTVGSRDSYSSSSRGYREEEPKYPKYRAIYRYLPQNEDELELNESDVIYVMEKCDDGWFVGLSARTKEFGTFPGNYVQPI